jgi:ribonuclease D
MTVEECQVSMSTIFLHKNDLPDTVRFGSSIAVDTETMGLNPVRDRLCLVQLSAGDGSAHLVQFDKNNDYAAPNLRRVMADPDVLKIFHYARFDIAIMKAFLKVDVTAVYCTKLASKLCRTYTSKHGLRDLCRDVLGLELNKQQQTSDWGQETLSEEQQVYAASDVLHLHVLKEKLDVLLKREGRDNIASQCFNFLPTRAALDIQGWLETDIFAHS